jgi:hypothetical protein
MRKIFAIVIMALVLVACSKDLKKDFETVFDKYNDALVSSDMRSTYEFVADTARASYIKSCEDSKHVRIFEYKIIKKTVDVPKRKASIEVDLDYYFVSSNKVKRLHYVQEWSLIETKEAKEWKLISPLPEFPNS